MSTVITNKPSTPDSDEFDFGRLIGELLDQKKIILTVIGFFTVIAIFYAVFATPSYQADALIQVEQKQGNSILSNLSQMLPDGQPVSEPEIALLQSRMILGKTVDDLSLQAQVQQKFFPIFGQGWARIKGDKPADIEIGRFYIDKNRPENEKITIKVLNNSDYLIDINGREYQGAVGKILNGNNFTVLVNQINAVKNTEFNIKYVSRLEAINLLQKSFTAVDQGKDTGMLNLTFTNQNPDIAQRVLNSISDNYLAQNISRQAAQDSKSLEFLENQLPQVRKQLDDSENKLSLYRKQSDSVDLTLQARSALDQIVNVDNQLNQLTFREAEVSQLFTKDHPTYIALLEKRKVLEQERVRLNKQVSSMPATQQEVLKLSRDVESGRSVYMQLLNRQQELSIAKNSAIGNVRIIDEAVTSPNPVKPKKVLIVLVGIFLGTIFSFGYVLLKMFLHRGIESPQQLEEIGINVYASIPISEWMSKQKLQVIKSKINKSKENLSFLALDNPADLAIEAIRGLRTSLHFAMMEAKNNVIMISGASPNAGKTFITANLAAVLAQTGKKVLFIDADMRKGYSHQVFKSDLENGLSSFLSGECTYTESIKKVDKAGFDFISRGNIPPNPSELLMHERFNKLLDWGSQHYDIILVDTPPILAVTDAAIIGSYVGTTLLVARFEENTAKEIEVSYRRFEQAGVNVKGTIINGVVKKISSYYGYGYNAYSYDYKS